MSRSWISAVAFAVLLTVPHAAGAQDEEARAQAREQFGRGVQRYQAADYQGALEAFQEAYRLAPHPSVRVNMANCYEHLGRPLEAMHHFERFLAESPDAPRQQRREVETAMRRLEQQIGQVRLAIAPDGALVTIDSAETRRAPILQPVRLTAGTHHIEVRMDGYRTHRQEIQVAGGETQRVAIRLERGEDEPVAAAEPAVSEETAEPAVADASADEVETAGAEAAEAEPVAEGTPPAEAPAGGGGFQLRLTLPVIIAGSAAAAFTVSAIISGSIAVAANDSFNGAVLRSNDLTLSQAERMAARQDGLAAMDTANTAKVLTDVFIIGAIAAAGVTTFFVIVDGMGEEPTTARTSGPRLYAAPSAGRDGAGLVLGGSF